MSHLPHRRFAAPSLRASLFLGAALLSCQGARAQDIAPTDAAAGALETVMVTAEKRSTNLQNTPISISAVNADDLAARHVVSLEDLGDGSIPSLRVAPFFARSSALTIGMRGIGAMGDANQPARDQAVGVYIDGVYLGRAQGLGAALYDVERIEVLKGPQGTLFGRNTEGGAINIVTRAPSGEFDMRAAAGYGNYDSYKAEAHVDLPSFHGISLKFDAMLADRDGTTVNPTTSGQPDFNAYQKRGFQAEALWQLTDTLKADYAFDVSHDATTPYYVQLLQKGALAPAPILPIQTGRADTANVGVPLQYSVGDTSGHRLNFNWDAAENLQVKLIGSYRDLKQTQFDNGEENLSAFAPNAPFSRYSLANVYQHQYSGELQVLGKFDEFDWVAGAFYYREMVRDNAQTPNSMQFNATGTAATTLSLDLNTVPFDRASHVATTSYGVYGQTVWTPAMLDGAAHLTLGGRLTTDEKVGDLDVVNGALPTYIDANKKTVTGVIPLDKSWTHFDPLVTLAYDLAEDVNVYGRWSTGYKAGGANSRSLTYRAFDPENVSMYEVGAKTEFWDHRARLNVAAYYGDLRDVQVDFQVLIVNNNRGTLETTNAATGTTRGFEADFTLMPIDGLTLGASYAYTDVKLSQAFNPFTNGLSTVYPLYTPKNTFSLSADYAWPLYGATLLAHLDGNYADAQYTSTTDPTLSDSSFIVNGRLAVGDIPLSHGDSSMELAVWSRNLLDESHAFLRNFNSALGTYGIYNEPRTFGVEARFKI